MPDFRAELIERLASVMGRVADHHDRYYRAMEAAEAQHKQETDLLERERVALQALLAIEEARDGIPAVQRPAVKPILPLGEFLTTKVHAHGPLDKDELRNEAEMAGYFNDATNGRSFHTTLLNFVKHGKIIQQPDGRYAYPVRPHPSLFADYRPEGAASQ